MISIKRCKTCNIEKSIDRFETINRKNKVYFKNTCKDCRNKSLRVKDPKIKKLFFDGENKECSSCQKVKPISEFSMKVGRPSFRCKQCHNEWYKNYYSKNRASIGKKVSEYKKDRTPNEARCRRHGINIEIYNEMLLKHNGACWICKTADAYSIDHDHSCCSGHHGCEKCVRGLLCSKCNALLGQANDSIDVLKASIEYLCEYGLEYKGV